MTGNVAIVSPVCLSDECHDYVRGYIAHHACFCIKRIIVQGSTYLLRLPAMFTRWPRWEFIQFNGDYRRQRVRRTRPSEEPLPNYLRKWCTAMWYTTIGYFYCTRFLFFCSDERGFTRFPFFFHLFLRVEIEFWTDSTNTDSRLKTARATVELYSTTIG